MAGKIDISLSEAEQAVKTFCEIYDSCSFVKPGPDLFEITTLDGEKVVVSLTNGSLECQRKPEIKEKLLGLIMDAREAPKGSKTALSPVGKANMSTPEKYGRKGPINESSALNIVKNCAQAIEPTYSVGGKVAPTAKTVLTAAADSGISFEVLRYTHQQDYIEACVRAHQGPTYDDAVVSIYKQDFINSRAWEMVGKQASKGNDILDLDMPYLENGMPNIKKDAMVNVKIRGGRDEIKTGFQKVNAQIWLYQELMQAWIFQGRQCVTKAKSKAASELLLASNPNTEIQEAGELADEIAEREMVERQKAEAA
jgi:hypothetical protein